MAREGRSLEKLAHALETLTSADTRVTLASPGRLRDLASGQVREHDVLMTFSDGHHTTITGFECRDRTAPVGVPDIEAYAAKCRRTGVHRPVIVSATGFTGTALEAARLDNVLLLALDEIDAIPWLTLDALKIEERAFIRFDADVVVSEPKAVGQQLTLLHDDGSPIDHKMMGERIMMGIDRSELKIGRNTLNVGAEGLIANARLEDGSVVPVSSLKGQLVCDLTEMQAPVALHSYGKPGQTGRMFASATFAVNGQDLRFVMSRRDDGMVEAILMPVEPPAQSAPARTTGKSHRKPKRSGLK